MAFGAVLANTGNSNTSIPASFSPSAAATVAIGNLIVVNVAERGPTGTCSGVTDNLGNSYTPLTSGGATNGSVKTFYSVCTVAGSSTPVAACTSSTADAAISCVVYEGPFAASPLDKNPAVLSDTTSPYASNATGTLTQADNLVVGYFGYGNGVTFSLPTPNPATIDRQDATGTGANTQSCGITSVVVAATTTVTMGVTGSASTTGVCGVAVFKKGAVVIMLGRPVRNLYFKG